MLLKDKNKRFKRLRELRKTPRKRYKRFREWQMEPHHVKPMSPEEHVCPTCNKRYVGNYCPRCGQSSMIGRYSFKNAFLLFIDVWGLGNRGMFRTIRDFFLRPGYMIGDYLRGMQMAYFPPFKMLFLICALGLLVDTGMNIKGINRFELYMQQEKESSEKRQASAQTDNSLTVTGKEASVIASKTIYDIENKAGENNQLAVLIALLLFSGPFYLLFRHCPAIPDLRFSECFVAMVYIINMVLICTIIPSFFCFSFKAEARFDLVAALLAIIPIKQLSGYSYVGTVWRMIVALIPFGLIAFFLYFSVATFVFISAHPELLK